MNREELKQAAAAQFKEKRDELVPLEVPKLGDGAVIYYRRRLNVREMSRVHKFAQIDGQFAGIVATFCYLAHDENGERLFNGPELNEMLNGNFAIDPTVIMDVVDRMDIGDLSAPADDAKKLSMETTPETN